MSVSSRDSSAVQSAEYASLPIIGDGTRHAVLVPQSTTPISRDKWVWSLKMAESAGAEKVLPAPEVATVPGCVFCRMASKEQQADLVYEDADYVCFPDRSPKATHHYLVVPKRHISTPGALTADDIPLVEKMAQIGSQVLAEKGAPTTEGARFGFHWPPFILVKHLHMHVMSPETSMGWLSRNIVFKRDSLVFYTPPKMIEYLKSKD